MEVFSTIKLQCFSLSPTRTLWGFTTLPPYAHTYKCTCFMFWTKIPESTPANSIKNNYYAAEKKMPGTQNKDTCYLHTSLIDELFVTLSSIDST